MSRRTMFWRMVASSILRRRSRVLIAVLAVAIGATTLSGLATIAIDVPAQMAREVRSYGANLVVSPAEDATSLSEESLESISDLITPGTLVGSAVFEYRTLLVNDQPFVSAGTDLQAVRAMNPSWYVEGGWPSQPNEVLIGEEIADTIGAHPGDRIQVAALRDNTGAHSAEGESQGAQSTPTLSEAQQAGTTSSTGASSTANLELTVAGILKTGGNEDSYMYMAAPDMSAFTGASFTPSIAEYSIAIEAGALHALADTIETRVPAVNAQAVKRLTTSDSGVLGMLRSLLAIITGIVLALTMIGVSTTMVAIVAERRTEIGLRKALGASSRSITMEFIGESLLLGLIGGVLGVALGYGLAVAISLNVFHRSFSLSPLIALITVLASLAIAVLACLPPVRRAAAVDPALVLRGE
ncbi:FtsX-like permease family protein [Schaalia cardiffensis]|uniref:ABC transporter permease n=1 Tax=Schaalia cardiffensis TaxID=181487 RepID=UPI0018E8417B|nr:FtsX-like permease family protein [Schaalia cardiffensis]MBJ2328824.1 FtsX-like permease family protein [Schaalia cardiffensis]